MENFMYHVWVRKYLLFTLLYFNLWSSLFSFIIANNQQSSRLLSFVGANCLLTMPSSKEQTSVEAGTIMDIILMKSIENTDVAPLLFSRDLQVNLYYYTAI